MAKECPLCGKFELNTAIDEQLGACGDCAQKVGIIPMPETRRPRVPCTRCNGMQFMRVIPREHTTTRIGDYNEQVSVPMYITHRAKPARGFFGGAVAVPTEHPGFGLLETYICRKCGFVEWYCLDVEKIPEHPHLMTELVDYEAGGPYR